MELPTHETNGSYKHRSDLTQIRGIGAIRKRWLHSLGISTIADLAQASAEAIEAQSKGDARFSRDELDGWIAQAQALQVSLESADALPAIKASTAVHDANPLTAADQTAAADPALETWNSIAAFQVNYQTRSLGQVTEQRLVVQHLGTDAAESWSTFDTNLLQQWMRDRLEVSLSPLQTPLQTELAMQTEAIAIEITQLRLMQPHYMRQPMTVVPHSPLFSDTIQTAKPFALEVSMQFVGLTDAHQGKQVAYRVQCFVYNLATGATESLSDLTTSVSLGDRSCYSVLLPSLLLRQPGLYRLKVLVTLQQAPATLGQFKVPMLQVV